MSALYLLPVFVLLLGGLFAWQPWAANMYFVCSLLTLPWSILPLFLHYVSPEAIPYMISTRWIYLFNFMQAVGGFFNAAIIYLVVGYVSWAVQSLIKR